MIKTTTIKLLELSLFRLLGSLLSLSSADPFLRAKVTKRRD